MKTSRPFLYFKPESLPVDGGRRPDGVPPAVDGLALRALEARVSAAPPPNGVPVRRGPRPVGVPLDAVPRSESGC